LLMLRDARIATSRSVAFSISASVNGAFARTQHAHVAGLLREDPQLDALTLQDPAASAERGPRARSRRAPVYSPCDDQRRLFA
jgi:hypothetical protein